TVCTHGPGAPRSALMPDWSPDGKTVAFASTPNAGQYIDLTQGAIATMSYAYLGNQHVFGEPKFIVPLPIALPGGVYDNTFFPSFSPDSALIVFNAARSSWRDFSDEKIPGPRLMLSDAKGAWMVDLTQLNDGYDVDNSWPHWAPGDTSDYYWVVYS